MGSTLNEKVSYTDRPTLYLQLAFTATFFVGVFQAGLGLLRLGFVIDFLSKSTLVGFMAGAAIIVSLQQLKGLLGIVHFTTKMQIIPVLTSVFQQTDEEGIAVGRKFASLRNYQVDGNQEMMAIDFVNMAGSYSSCYVITGSCSRSAVNYNAGAQTMVSNILMSTTVLINLLFLMQLFYYTPNVILGAIIITVVIGLIDYEAALRLWNVGKLGFLTCLCSFFGV